MEEEWTSNAPYKLHVVLNEGFRDHTVAVTVEGREVYFRSGVTTDPETSLADALDIPIASRATRVTLSATPGNLVGSLDIDVVAHPHLSICLVGDGTVSFEIRPPGHR